MIKGLFDLEKRISKIDRNGDPLALLNKIVDWEQFRPQLQTLRIKERKSNAGRKPYDVVLMFKIMVLQSLFNLSDDSAEQMILDRLSFCRFLGATLGDDVPDAKTIWAFREAMSEIDLAKSLFAKFDEFLRENGFQARKGQIIDASIVEVPKQHNTEEENELIKSGEAEKVKASWSPAKAAQKDTDARWTKKNNRSFFGYKHHDSVDVKHKIVRSYVVTSANVHDSNHFADLVTDNTNSDIYADSAYRSEEHEELLQDAELRSRIQRKGKRGKELSDWEKQGNRTRAKIRARVEHVFGIFKKRMIDPVIRTVGLVRAKTKIGLRHLAYNISRYAYLSRGTV